MIFKIMQISIITGSRSEVTWGGRGGGVEGYRCDWEEPERNFEGY